jgi:hypothetical protein
MKNETSKTTELGNDANLLLPTGRQKIRIAWNRGKRKPVEEDGELWCNCKYPKLTSNAGGRGQALCLLCGYPWYH